MKKLTYIVHFSGKGITFKTGKYRSRKAIRQAQDRYEIEFRGPLALNIMEKDTLQHVNIFEVKS